MMEKSLLAGVLLLVMVFVPVAAVMMGYRHFGARFLRRPRAITFAIVLFMAAIVAAGMHLDIFQFCPQAGRFPAFCFSN